MATQERRKFKDTNLTAIKKDRVEEVKSFLNQHYHILMNEFEPGILHITPADPNAAIQHPTQEDISLHLISHGISGSDRILSKILKSHNQVETFNPVTDYLNELEGKWKGENTIEKLCSYVKVREFGDKPEKDYYQKRLVRIFKKWMAACIACSLGDKPNDAVFGLIHSKEGVGKTTFINNLVPEVLYDYSRTVNKQNTDYDISETFTKNFMVLFDDNAGLTRSNAEPIKAALSARDFNVKRYFSVKKSRIANCALTSNKTNEMGGFLISELGTRRWALVEIEDIDHQYSKVIDVDQLWAEAYVLYNTADYDYVWGQKDFEEFAEYNARYTIETQSKKLIREYYRHPNPDDKEEDIEFKQSIEIMQDLRKARKITTSMTNVSEVTIGIALTQLGYERTSKRNNKTYSHYGYYVVKLY